MRLFRVLFAALIAASASLAFAETTPADGPYKIVNTAKVGGDGGFDYVYADSDSRHLFVVRSGNPGGRISVYDLDTVKLVKEIPDVKGGHGVAVDPKSGHAFSSSNPVVMFDSKTLETIKTIDVTGRPDGILFEPSTARIYVLSHSAPNVTVINAADGTIAGTIDLGGAPEQGASDGKGHVYICVEDKGQVAVVDASTMKTTAHYDLGEKGRTPAGMAMDMVNNILFVYCRKAQSCVILNAADGKILATLPTGSGVDAAEFNPKTMEAFSSHGDGTLTVIKENSPTSFAVEQNVQTRKGAKTSTLDSKTGQIYLIAADRAAPAAGGRGGAVVPGSFTIIIVGK
jgi:DNA-binding beta-propeller fold protein YncE